MLVSSRTPTHTRTHLSLSLSAPFVLYAAQMFGDIQNREEFRINQRKIFSQYIPAPYFMLYALVLYILPVRRGLSASRA